MLGKKLFLLHHYIYLDDVQGPVEKNGRYCNPIVQSHSKDIRECFRVLSKGHSMLISIERFSPQETEDLKQALLENR